MIPATNGHTFSPSALADLQARLADRGCDADPDTIAMILLELAHEGGWVKHPQNAAEWIGQLAMEMVRTKRAPV